MNTVLRVLHLEDDSYDAELIREMLTADGIAAEITRVDTRAGFLAALEQEAFDVILADYALPSFDGLTALAMARDRSTEVPFIFVSGTLGEEVAIECLRKGATDYVLKHRLVRLGACVRRAMRELKERRDRQTAEAELRRNEASLANAQRIAKLGNWDFDLANQRLHWSAEVYEIFGVARESFDGTMETFLGRAHPEDRALMQQAYDEALTGKGGLNVEHRVVASDGTLKHVRERGEVEFDGAGRPVRIHGTVLDITERKLAEARLHQSERNYRELFENNPMPMWVYDEETLHFLAANEAAVRHYGYSQFEFLKMTLLDLHVSEVHARLLADLQGDPDTRLREGVWPQRKRDGTVIEVELTTHELEFGGRRGRLVLANDVTEQRRAQEALRRSQSQLRSLTAHLEAVREEERTRISREIHDELGQMLTGLKMDLRWIERRLVPAVKPDLLPPLQEKILAASQLADETITTVQRIAAELRPGILDNLGLLSALRYEAGQFERRTGIPCELSLPPEQPRLEGRVTTAIYRVFQEILTNVARHSHATRVRVEFKQDAGTLTLAVLDNGTGISQEALTDVNSLGLLGMRERARLLNGNVRISGGPGSGTRVSFELPVPGLEDERG